MDGLHTIKTFLKKRFSANSTVEIILAISLFMMYGTFIIGALAYSINATKIPNTQKTAIRYASEGLELTRYIRKSSLTNLPNGTYGLSNSGVEWSLIGTPETLETIYSRSISITSPTASEKLVTSTVSWTNTGRTGSESVTTLLTNWQDTITPLVVPWQTPAFAANYQITATTTDLMYLKIYNGLMYGTLLNGTTSSAYTSFNISAYPTVTQGTSVTLNAVATDEAYRYLAGDGITRFYFSSALNTIEVTGVNAATPALIGPLNMTGNTDANGIAANGNTLYVTRTTGADAEFNILQNTGTTTYTTLGTMQSTSTYYDVVLKNTTYAYVTTNNTAGELVIVNISNSAAPVVSSTINLPTAVAGRFDMIQSGNYLILHRTSGTVTGSVVYIYDCTTPATPVLTGSYALPFLVYDADVDPARNLLFVVTSDTAAEFRVIDFSAPATPVSRGIYNNAVNGTFRSVAWDSANDRIYIGTTDNTNEMVILNNQ